MAVQDENHLELGSNRKCTVHSAERYPQTEDPEERENPQRIEEAPKMPGKRL